MNIIEKNDLKINSKLFEFVNNEILPGTAIDSDKFWNNFEKIVHELSPINKNLIKKKGRYSKKN